MQVRSQKLIVLWLASVSIVASCASQQPLVTIGRLQGETELKITAGNFKFVPDNIRAYEGQVLVFRIENISDTKHNFTIKDPEGHILQSAPLPPKETTTVKVDFSEPGLYEFYCDKPFHAAFGMRGRIEIVRKP